MYFYAFIYMCCYITLYLYFQFTQTPMPGFLPYLNKGIGWGFILLGAYISGKIIVDCLASSAKGQMTQANMAGGILLALLHFLPTLLIALFMLKEGFRTAN